MRFLEPLFEKNRLWAERMQARDPNFFKRLTIQPEPTVSMDRLFR